MQSYTQDKKTPKRAKIKLDDTMNFDAENLLAKPLNTDNDVELQHEIDRALNSRPVMMAATYVANEIAALWKSASYAIAADAVRASRDSGRSIIEEIEDFGRGAVIARARLAAEIEAAEARWKARYNETSDMRRAAWRQRDALNDEVQRLEVQLASAEHARTEMTERLRAAGLNDDQIQAVLPAQSPDATAEVLRKIAELRVDATLIDDYLADAPIFNEAKLLGVVA